MHDMFPRTLAALPLPRPGGWGAGAAPTHHLAGEQGCPRRMAVEHPAAPRPPVGLRGPMATAARVGGAASSLPRRGGAVRPSTTLSWDPVDDSALAGYKIYWRDTTAPQWTHSRFVGNVTEFTLEDMVIDNYLYGVASVGVNGHESYVVFPTARR